MFRSTFLSSLTVLTLALSAWADVHRNDEHQFEVQFPAKVQRYNKKINEGGQLIMAYSQDLTRTFIMGVILNAEDLSSEQSQEFSSNFVEGYMNERKQASITHEEEIKLNDTTPKGISYLVKHERGHIFAWVTIENGKAYFVIIEGPTEASLQGEVIKNFKNSVKIMGVK